MEEKLLKSLEALKINLERLSGGGTSKATDKPLLSLRILKPETCLSRKEYVHHCKTVIELLCTPELWNVKSFPQHLRTTLEILLVYANDDDGDRRNTAVEGITRLICVLFESQSSNLLFNFYCEIKRNGPSRCLRLALSKFADLAHLIRPNRLEGYAASLYPLLTKIAARSSDDLLQETLFNTSGRVFAILGPYAPEREVAELLNAYLANLEAESPSVRRCSAISIASLCEHGRRPSQLGLFVLKSLLNLVNSCVTNKSKPQQGGINLHSAIFITFRAVLAKLVKLDNLQDRSNETSNLIVKDVYYLYHHLLAVLRYSSETVVIVSALEALVEFYSLALFDRVVLFISALNQDFQPNETHDNVFQLADTDIKSSRSGSSKDDDLNDLVDSYHDGDCLGAVNFMDQGGTATEYSASEIGGPSELEDMSELASELNFDETQDDDHLKTEDDNSFDLASQASSWMRKSQLDSVELGSEATTTRPPTSIEMVNVEHFNLGEMNCLQYAATLIALKFLLTGSEQSQPLIDDEAVRVSLKSIALSCITAMIKTSPSILYLPFIRDDLTFAPEDGKVATMATILNYAHHNDPNVRAQIALLIATYLERILSYPQSYLQWSKKLGVDKQAIPIVQLINMLESMLSQSSSLLAKHTLASVQLFLPHLLISNECEASSILHLVHTCLELRGDSYWLVRGELVTLVSRLPFRTLQFLDQKYKESENEVDSKLVGLTRRIVDDVIFKLMFDGDHRVRQIVLNNLGTLVENVCLNVLLESPLEASTLEAIVHRFSAPYHTKIFNEMFPSMSDVWDPLDYDRPSRSMFTANVRASEDQLDSSLLYFVHRCLHEMVCVGTHRKASMVGAVNALAKLVKVFPPCKHVNGWQVDGVTHVIGYLLTLLTKNASILLDLSTQQSLMSLVVQIILSAVVSQTKKLQYEPERVGTIHSEADFLAQIGNGELCEQLEQMFVHLLKCLVAYVSLVEHDPSYFITFIYNLYTRSGLSRLLSSSKQTTKKDSKTMKKELASKGSFKTEANALDPLYGRLFQLLKSYWKSRKTSELADAFLGTILQSLAKLLQIVPSSFILTHLDDMLVYLNIVYFLDVSNTVRVVRHLLGCIFHVNYLSLYVEVAKQHLIANPHALASGGTLTKLEHEPSLYNIVYTLPYLRFNHFCNAYRARGTSAGGSTCGEGYYGTFLSWHRKLIEFKHVKIMNADESIGNAGKRQASQVRSKIRLFEALVIKTMRHYRFSADKQFQCEVLDLFAQLVQFHINYTMLDSSHDFLRSALKQIEFAETLPVNKNNLASYQRLLTRVFNFLAILCHENVVPEEIVSLPGLIQFCDRLVAAGHGKLAINGLNIIVDHIFFFLNEFGPSENENANLQNLEAQREVVVAYCFKLLDLGDYRTFDLLSLIVNYYKGSNRTKLVNLSIRIGDILVTRLVNGAIAINSIEGFEALQNLIFSLAPTTFMGTIDLVRCLLATKSSKQAFPLTVIFLKLVILNLNEKTLLESLDKSKDQDGQHEPEAKLVAFLLDKLGTFVAELCETNSTKQESEKIVVYLLSNYLLSLTYIFQSGLFPKLTKSASDALAQHRDFDLDRCLLCFKSLSKFEPTLSAHWLNLLCVLSYDRLPEVLVQGIESSPVSSINLEIVRRCSFILLCDYLSENLESDVEYLSWLIINHLGEVIVLDQETPIHEFLVACHRRGSSSALFLQSIGSRHLDLLSTLGPIYALKMLRCLERAHFSQSVTLIKFLLEQFLFNEQLVAGYYNCIKYAEYIASNRLEALFESRGCTNRPSLSDMNNLIRILKHTPYMRLNHTVHTIKAKHFSCRRRSTIVVRDPLTEVAHHSPEEALAQINVNWFGNIMRSYLSTPLRPNQADQVRSCLSKLSALDIQRIILDRRFDISNLGLAFTFLDDQDLNWSPVKSRSEIDQHQVAETLILACCFYLRLLDSSKTSGESEDIKVAQAFLPVLTTLVQKSAKLEERYSFCLRGNQLTASVVVEVYGERALKRAQEEGDIVTLLNILDLLDKFLGCQMFSLDGKEDEQLEAVLVRLQCELVHSLYGIFQQYYRLPRVEHTLPMEDEGIASSCLHLVSMLRAIELNASKPCRPDNEQRVCELVHSQLSTITLHLSRLPLFRCLLLLPYDHYDIHSVHYPSQFWSCASLGGKWKTRVPVVSPSSIEEYDLFLQFAYRVENIGFATRIEFEEIWMTLLGVLSKTLSVLEKITTTTASGDHKGEEAYELIHLAGAAIQAITNLLHKAKWNNNNQHAAIFKTYSGKSLFGTKLETIRKQIREHISQIDEQLERWKPIGGYQEETTEESIEATLAVLRDNARRSCKGSEGSMLSSPTKTVAIGDESIDLYSCIHFLLDIYLQTLGTCLTSKACLHFPLFSMIARSCVTLSDLFVEQAQYDKVTQIWQELELGVVDTYEDELLNQHFIMGMAKAYAMANAVTRKTETFNKYCKAIIEHNLKDFFVPTKIGALKALNLLIECDGQAIGWKDAAVVVDYIGKHFTLESISPLTYNRAFQRCLDRLSLTLIQTYRDLTLGADFIDRSAHSLLRILTSPGVRDTLHAHAVLEHLLFSDKLSTKQIKSIKSSTLHALKAGGQVGGGRVATLHRLNLLVITSYLLRVGNPATQVGQEDELYKTMERLSSMFEPLRVCNSLEADVLSQTLATFLVDFFPPEHLLNKCLGEFLSSQQQHCKYLARMLFAIFSRFQADVHHYGTDTSQEWIVLSLSSFTQLVPITLGLWALTCFLVCGAQNHWIRASFPFFQSRFGQFSEEDKDTFFTICYHVFMEIKSDVNKKTFVKTFQKAACTGCANPGNGSSTPTTLTSSPYFEVLKFLSDS